MDERAVIVTGGSSGLGAAVVAEAAARGWSCLTVDRQAPNGPVDEHVEHDLSDTRGAEAAVRDLCRRHPVAGVVTAAGTDACGPFGAIDAEAWEQVVAVNLLATAAVVRGALDALAESCGRVVTVASTLGLRGCPDATAYCASKFGVIGFTQALAAETAGRIGVTCLVPGGMDTAFFAGRDPQYQPPPDAALADPADVAGTVLFALEQPPGVEVRQLLVTPSRESSWP